MKLIDTIKQMNHGNSYRITKTYRHNQYGIITTEHRTKSGRIILAELSEVCFDINKYPKNCNFRFTEGYFICKTSDINTTGYYTMSELKQKLVEFEEYFKGMDV